MVPLWWSIILTVVGVTGLFFLTKKKWYGFAIGLGAQVLWVSYAVATRQWGFLGSCVAYGAVNLIGLNNWLSERKNNEG